MSGPESGRRAFPVVYATDVTATARFWDRLGFTQFVQLPAEGDPGYVGLRRDGAELAVTAREWARDQYGLALGDGPRFEMFVYTDDVDTLIAALRAEGSPSCATPPTCPGANGSPPWPTPTATRSPWPTRLASPPPDRSHPRLTAPQRTGRPVGPAAVTTGTAGTSRSA